MQKVARKEKNNIDQNEKRLLEIQEVAKKESPRIEDPWSEHFPCREVPIVKTVTEVLKMLPEVAGRGQHFQVRGHGFSLYDRP